ncbi:MAG: hypothetical protein P8X90_34680 [Desulfobacterales bacterium]
MLDGFSYYYGEMAALSAAFLWALASVLYGRIGQYLAPLKMNLLKNIIAMVMAMIKHHHRHYHGDNGAWGRRWAFCRNR